MANKVPHDGGSEEREGETLGGRRALTRECAHLTVSQIFQGWCPSTPTTKMATTVPAASNGIMEIDEKPMHQTTQEELDALERAAPDESGVMQKSLEIMLKRVSVMQFSAWISNPLRNCIQSFFSWRTGTDTQIWPMSPCSVRFSA